MAQKIQRSRATFPIKLTALQRDTVCQYPNLKTSIARRLTKAGEGTQVLNFSVQELDHLENELAIVAFDARHPEKQRLVAVLTKVQEVLSQQQMPAVPDSPNLLFQFKIRLQEYDMNRFGSFDPDAFDAGKITRAMRRR